MEAFIGLIAFIYVVPVAAKIAAKAVALDAKLDPEEGEDETRIVKKPTPTKRANRSFYRRWLRAANYRVENIERVIEGRPVDNCPRLTRAKRNLRKSLTEDHAQSAKRKDTWRETESNYQSELDRQRIKREIEAEINYHKIITIDDVECERAIIAADGEGMDGGVETVNERPSPIPGQTIKWPDHYTILLGAGGVGFTKEGKPLDLPCIWVGHENKRQIDGIEAIELYLSLPDRYGKDCYFVMFSFNYDTTMLLKGLRQGRSKKWHYERVWEICKRQDFETKKVRNNTIFIGDYAISYIKSKVLIIHKLDDENNVIKRVTIWDVFGFYQTSFVQVVASLVPLGLATEEEVETMRQNKTRRNDFNSPEWPLERIKAYTTEELRKLSIAVTVLRKAAADDGIRLPRLDGAGNLSAGMMRKHKVMRHYKGLMKKYNAGEEQLIGYHADFGGRIELVKQGYDEYGISRKYDERSSYPHKSVPLPSMIGGFWVKREWSEFDWADVEQASPVSMFKVRWLLPERYIDARGHMQVVPFFPLPYRLEGGSIRFFSMGLGWYFREEVIFLKRWLERFAQLGACVNPGGSWWRVSKGEASRLIADPFARRRGYGVDLMEARLFYPANDERPFAFVPEAFEKRKLILDQIRDTGKPNIGEKVIKLGLNGLSGKVAQSIGGSETKPPSCYNVHYAGAIRAGTRRSIGEAALQAPHEIIQFCTDAVFSEVPLILDEGKELGQWELEEVKGLLTVQSGVYSYMMEGGKIENKTRGFAAGSVATMNELDLEAIENHMKLEGVSDKKLKMLSFREALLNKVPDAWRQSVIKPDGSFNSSPEIVLILRTFMTAGAAVASKDRFDLIGRWANVPKRLAVHTPGPKRRLLTPEDCDGDAERVARMYWSIGKEAARCHELVPTAPSRPEGDTWQVMSRPHIPKWYEGDAELANDWAAEEDYDSEEILMGDQ